LLPKNNQKENKRPSENHSIIFKQNLGKQYLILVAARATVDLSYLEAKTKLQN
jgi:hypothetical protein